MQILWQIIAFCLTTSVQGEPKEVNYCGRLDVRPDHVKHYLTTPGYPARAAEEFQNSEDFLNYEFQLNAYRCFDPFDTYRSIFLTFYTFLIISYCISTTSLNRGLFILSLWFQEVSSRLCT